MKFGPIIQVCGYIMGISTIWTAPSCLTYAQKLSLVYFWLQENLVVSFCYIRMSLNKTSIFFNALYALFYRM